RAAATAPAWRARAAPRTPAAAWGRRSWRASRRVERGGGRGEEHDRGAQLRPGAALGGRRARHGRGRALRAAHGGGGGGGAGGRAHRGGARVAARLQGRQGGAARARAGGG